MVRGWGGGRQRIDKGVGGYATAFCVETLKDAMARHGKESRTTWQSALTPASSMRINWIRTG
jgi:hypothetical protein